MITDKTYRKYKKFAMVITSNDEYISDEIVQELMIKLFEKGKEVNDNYAFISLKNRYLNYLNKEKKHTHSYDYDELFDDSREEDKFDEEIYQEESDIIDYNLKIIDDVVSTLDYFNKQLYILHFVKGFSQRKIARESGITLAIIHQRIKKIKNKIKDEKESRDNQENN